MRGGILDCRCARRSARRQVGTKGWSYSDRTKGWALELNSTALATMPNLLNLTHTTDCAPSTRHRATPSLPSAGNAMPRQEGGHDQLAYERAQKQTDEAVDDGSKGQIELRRKTVEHRRGYLTTTSFILGESLAAIIGRNRSGLRSIRSYDARRLRWRSRAAARVSAFDGSTRAAGRESARHPHPAQ